MNSDSSELETSSNGRSLFMPPSSSVRASTTATAAAKSATPSASGGVRTSYANNTSVNSANAAKYHNKTQAIDVGSDFNLNNEMNATFVNNVTTPGAGGRMGRGGIPKNKYVDKQQQERYVWEMRSRSPNQTTANTVLNSTDPGADMQYAMPKHNRQQKLRIGRSPGNQQLELSNRQPQIPARSGSPTDVGKGDGHCLRDGEIVVFDDIDTNWMNKTNSTNSYKLPTNTSNCSNSHHMHHNKEDILKVTKMIGQLPIAEYEGSPRRFGNQPQKLKHQHSAPSSTVMPKRAPGFPQRVSPKSATMQQLPKQQETAIALHHSQYQHQPQQQHQHQRQHQYYNSSAYPSNDNNKSIGNLIDIDDDCYDGNNAKAKTPTFDYLYEFSETRKVLEEFFKGKPEDEKRFAEFIESGDDAGNYEYEQEREAEKHIEQAYIGQRLARIPKDELYMVHRSPKKQPIEPIYTEHNEIELYIDTNSRSSGDLADTELEANIRRYSRNFTLSPETTDYDSNCGDLDSLSNEMNGIADYGKLYAHMPVLEDGLSSGHASDTENIVTAMAVAGDKSKFVDKCNERELSQQTPQTQNLFESNNEYNESQSQECLSEYNSHVVSANTVVDDTTIDDLVMGATLDESFGKQKLQHSQQQQQQQQFECNNVITNDNDNCCNKLASPINSNDYNHDSNYEAVYAAAAINRESSPPPPPPPAPVSHRPSRVKQQPHQQHHQSQNRYQQHQQQQQAQHRRESADIKEAMKEIRSALQRAKTQPEKLKFCDEVLPPDPDSPVWVPRKNVSNNGTINAKIDVKTNHIHKMQHCISDGSVGVSVGVGVGVGGGGEEEEADTDLETDRLLGQQRLDDQGFFDDKTIWPKTSRIGSDSNDQSPTTSDTAMLTPNSVPNKPQAFSSATIRQGIGTALTPSSPDRCQIVGNADVALTSPEKIQYTKSPTGSVKSLKDSVNTDKKAKSRHKEGLLDPSVLIEGVLFRARYLGSTQLVCEGQPTKTTRMMQAEEAVSRIKAPEGESQPSTEVDLFISTEKIMVLNTDLKEIMMDHALRTISYIADIGDLVVLMARRRFVPSDSSSSDADGNSSNGSGGGGSGSGSGNGGSSNNKDNNKENNGSGSNKHNRTPKMICHVFESDEAQFIAQSIGQAFQVAYMEFLKANGIEDNSFVKEMDYQEVLNSQEIFGDELEIFAKKEKQKEVVVPKAKGEILGVVIVESGWGSMLPTVVIANLMSGGAAARCGQLNIGDQLIAINGMSLVGLPLTLCQNYIRNAKNQTAVKFTVVPCPPVVEVKIKRPNTKYQLGFSVQNGVICSLLRGGIAERGGVRVGHRIIEINNQSVVAVPHEKIVNLLATSVGEILMKTMPTSMFRLLTGQENPIYI